MRQIPFYCLWAVLALVLSCGPAHAQTTPIKNPRQLAFTSSDHALVDRYEIDVLKLDGSVVQTLTVQKADTSVDSATGDILVSLNVQPIAFGQYQFRVRAVAGTVSSDNSANSDTWERAPGQPGKPAVKG